MTKKLTKKEVEDLKKEKEKALKNGKIITKDDRNTKSKG